MSLFTDLLANVYTVTNRPDLVAETTLAVKAATLKLHRIDYFSKDLFETGVSFSTSDYFQTLDYKTIIPLFRTIKYLRKYDSVNLKPGIELKAISIEKVLDGYGVERQDVFYQAGSVLQIKSSTQEQYYLIGAYLNPIIDPATYNSWIAQEFPMSVVYVAASIVFTAIHQAETAAAMDKLAASEMAEILMHNIETVGS